MPLEKASCASACLRKLLNPEKLFAYGKKGKGVL
jgi:hypothetical protein